MRTALALALFMFCLSTNALGQQQRAPTALPAPISGAPGKQYSVQIAEFQLVDTSKEGLLVSHASDLDQLKKTVDVNHLETMRVLCETGSEAQIALMKTVAVTVGVTSSQFGKQRNVQDRPVGGSFRVALTEVDENRVSAQLSYETTRVMEAPNEESTPDSSKTTYMATVVAQVGKPLVLYKSTSSANSYLMLLIKSTAKP